MFGDIYQNLISQLEIESEVNPCENSWNRIIAKIEIKGSITVELYTQKTNSV